MVNEPIEPETLRERVEHILWAIRNRQMVNPDEIADELEYVLRQTETESGGDCPSCAGRL